MDHQDSDSMVVVATEESPDDEPAHKKARINRGNDAPTECDREQHPQETDKSNSGAEDAQDKNLTSDSVHAASLQISSNATESSAEKANTASEKLVAAGEQSAQSVIKCNTDKSDKSEKKAALTEVQAGITEYLGDHSGFSAIIKQRYSDFIVNEVDIEGNVVHLKSLSPAEDSEDVAANEEDKVNNEILNVISSEDLAKLEDLAKCGDKHAVVNVVAPEDKSLRTNIHLAIKKTYDQLETKTTEVDGKKVIQAMLKSGKSRNSQNRDEWPQSKKSCKYVKFVLYKENKDTMDAISLISKQLKVKESMFQYAGTKDKRAKTSQEVTAHRIHPKKLSFLNKVLWNMGLGDFRYVSEPLKLGQLSGNQFTIVLRNVLGNTEQVEKAMSSIKSHGFINYFGMQRFGTTSIPTHKVGSALLHGDWDQALDLILMPRDDNAAKDAFQRVWMETHDPEATLKVTPRYCGLERTLLEALKRKMKPFNALEKISRNTRLLYVHSYQALVWNQMVSKRLKNLGHNPVIGDLVLSREAEKSEHPKPTVLTSENVAQYSLHDVVLPLPGHDVIYPNHEAHDWYRKALEADGLDIDKMKRPQKDYSLPGAYRHITVLPSDVSWSTCRYDDYTLPLALSDLDVINGEKLPDSHNKGKLKAVVLKMTLPPSCYATMALREILRQDTSVASQTLLNVT